MRLKPKRLQDRMAENADRPNECWQWEGAKTQFGYAKSSAVIDGALVFGTVHRLAYMITVGPIPDGLELDHLCRNRLCYNPKHLEAVTARENSLRSMNAAARNARKTHCPKGHPLEGANLRANKYGWRMCRTCFNENMNRKIAEGRIRNRGPNSTRATG